MGEGDDLQSKRERQRQIKTDRQTEKDRQTNRQTDTDRERKERQKAIERHREIKPITTTHLTFVYRNGPGQFEGHLFPSDHQPS